MTTRERIATLYDGGTEPHMIAALLDLDVTDVAETLADPAHEPAAPAAASAPARYFWYGAVLGPDSNADPNHLVNTIGIDVTVPVLATSVPNRAQVAQTSTSSIGYSPAGTLAYNAFGVAAIGLQGTDSIKPFVGGVLWQVGAAEPNWAKFRLTVPSLTVAAHSYSFTEADVTLVAQSGEDFSLGESAEGAGAIMTEAGGAFQASVYLELDEAELE